MLLLAAYFLYIACSLIISPLIESDGAVDFEFTESTGSTRVLLVDENSEALDYRLSAIDSAEDEIIISTFRIDQDDVSCKVLAALYKAAQRGVDIKIIVDGIQGQMRLFKYDEFKALASLDNVEVKFYNKIDLLRPWLQNYHLHDKYFIIDDQLYIVGGRNIARRALSDGENTDSDSDVIVYESDPGEGTSLTQLREYFDVVWNLDECEYVTYNLSEKKLAEAFESLEEHYVQSEDFDWMSITYAAESIQILTNPVNAATTSADIWDSICELMAEGDEVIIRTPYIMCDSQMYEDLAAVCTVSDVEMVINSPVTGNNVMGSVDYMNSRKKIYATGLTTYEWYGGTHSSHTKAVLIDDDICVIGSYNFDMRSNYLDTEIMLVIDCPELNAQLRADTQELMSESKMITSDGEVSYGENFESAEMSFSKKCIYSILRVLIIPFRHML